MAAWMCLESRLDSRRNTIKRLFRISSWSDARALHVRIFCSFNFSRPHSDRFWYTLEFQKCLCRNAGPHMSKRHNAHNRLPAASWRGGSLHLLLTFSTNASLSYALYFRFFEDLRFERMVWHCKAKDVVEGDTSNYVPRACKWISLVFNFLISMEQWFGSI